MNCAIGLDLVEIARCAAWHTYSDEALRRIFSEEEIIYCRADTLRSAERFAARFAAREAFYKALATSWLQSAQPMPPFLTVCRALSLRVAAQRLHISVMWDRLFPVFCSASLRPPHIALSLSHTGTTAAAVVVLFDVIQ
jgi:phosphopantetheine--protein transferase-like protein